MPNTSVALVTGANQGIGLQIAKDLVGHGFTVLAGSRNLANGESAAKSIGAHAIQLDVTDAASIAAAAARITAEYGKLDVLVNNAGISKVGKQEGKVEDIAKNGRLSVVPLDDVRAIYDVNVFGVIAVTQAMIPLLRKSSAARIVNVSSGVGSLARTLGPGGAHLREIFGAYSISKAALNSITVGFAIELEKDGIKVNGACPGFTKTNLNNFQGTKTVEEGAREPVRLALLGPDGPTGTYSNDEGPLPW
ncbi:MAG TPA: SDR family NAD(P)-dependent oxidoreductase [Rhizomicrobium sp.]|nr:SDR family NAD(P)-dependent oxidoreductase [Rhizomicrobium sp.]